MSVPGYRLQYDMGGGDFREPPLGTQPGPDLIVWAMENLPGAQSATLNQQSRVGITADMSFRGTSLCHGHLWRAVEAYRHEHPRSLWW
jgi:hypothetical protein